MQTARGKRRKININHNGAAFEEKSIREQSASVHTWVQRRHFSCRIQDRGIIHHLKRRGNVMVYTIARVPAQGIIPFKNRSVVEFLSPLSRLSRSIIQIRAEPYGLNDQSVITPITPPTRILLSKLTDDRCSHGLPRIPRTHKQKTQHGYQ